jgi:Holliday junction resolvasome RuvABC endonuclease subunit
LEGRVVIWILGCDPGLASFGVARVELTTDSERIVAIASLETAPSPKKRKVRVCEDTIRRVQELALALKSWAGDEPPAAVAFESMSLPRNASASSKVGMSFGMLGAAAVLLGWPLVQATPQELKKAMCGKASASKREVEQALVRRYPEAAPLIEAIPKSKREHPVDAAAVVVTCLNDQVIRMARRMAA